MKRVAFIGLGVMGYPMAGHLHKAGYDVAVYNRSAEKSKRWVEEFGGSAYPTPKAATENAEFVFCCVGNDDDLRQVVLGTEGIASALAPNAVLIDHTTASAEVAREIADLLQEQGAQFLDAPVSGGQQGAENGALTVMIGGDAAVFEKAKPVIDVFARSAQLMGPVGSGQLCKMVNQICIAGLVQGLAEGLHFAEQAGLDGNKVVDVIGKGAAQSWQMDNRHQTMLADQYDHGFAVDWMRKDLSIVLQEARTNGASLPVTALVDQFYGDVQAMGGGRWDTSSLLTRLKPKT